MAGKKGMAVTQASTADITATVEPEGADNTAVSWVSDTEAVATVTSDSNPATITAVAAGSATVTCTTEDGGFTDTVDVRVTGGTEE